MCIYSVKRSGKVVKIWHKVTGKAPSPSYISSIVVTQKCVIFYKHYTNHSNFIINLKTTHNSQTSPLTTINNNRKGGKHTRKNQEPSWRSSSSSYHPYKDQASYNPTHSPQPEPSSPTNSPHS
ncbi:hypothetical protein HanRHA438_Chr09g0421561 [Helianthus annuus]|nr:hypothetical protein HanIR_Chr09g0441351 [Helianthus annuus]KAJ0890239.1 hypothetical protein HanRHA438_Chr09g0421561 [Helianthus annuus]